MNNKPLPRSVDQLNAKWFTEVLNTSCPGIRVDKVTTDEILWGTATKIMARLDYSGNYEEYGIPEKLCVKGEFDEKLRQKLEEQNVERTGTQGEAQFYQTLGTTLGIKMPTHWYAASEPGMGILIMNNLGDEGCTFGDPVTPWSVELVRGGIDLLASLHAATWGKKFPEIDWLTIGSDTLKQYSLYLLSEDRWQEHLATPGIFELPEALRDREKLVRASQAMWQYDEDNHTCLIHGDAHLGNTYVDANGQPFFLDWAAPAYSHWAFDITYFIVGSLSVKDRRENEVALMEYYIERLAKHGGPQLEWSSAWEDYKRHHFSGLLWSILPANMQTPERVAAMGERYTTAIIEHNTLDLLGV